MHIKKAWNLVSSLESLRSSTTYFPPITTSKAHAYIGGSAVALLSGENFESVEVSKIPV